MVLGWNICLKIFSAKVLQLLIFKQYYTQKTGTQPEFLYLFEPCLQFLKIHPFESIMAANFIYSNANPIFYEVVLFMYNILRLLALNFFHKPTCFLVIEAKFSFFLTRPSQALHWLPSKPCFIKNYSRET